MNKSVFKLGNLYLNTPTHIMLYTHAGIISKTFMRFTGYHQLLKGHFVMHSLIPPPTHRHQNSDFKLIRTLYQNLLII